MQIISIIGQKGGTGKTTIAIGLAVQAVTNNKSCIVVDLDPQASASNWGDRRNGKEPFVISTMTQRLKNVLETAKTNSIDLVIIDTAGKSTDASIASCKVSNKIIIPIQPNVFDTETLSNVKDILTVSNNKCSTVVINKAQSRTKRHITTIDVISKLGFEICPVILFQRAAHIESSNIGLSAFEFEPKGKASKEMCDLYNYFLGN